MPGTDPPQLDYAPKPKLAHRAWTRRLIALLFVLLLTPVLWRSGRASVERIQVNRLYARCASHAWPADKVVFDTDYSEDDQHFTCYTPPIWPELNQVISGAAINSRGTAFLHELRTPLGARRLVGVDLILLGRSQLQMQPRKLMPGISVLRRPTEVGGNQSFLDLEPTKGVVRVYAGQLDPSDPSHFTINYTAGGRDGVIDGYLKDDDTVVLEPCASSTTQP